MGALSLLVVPDVFPLAESRVYRSLNCLVLDDLVYCDEVGVIFKRMRIAGFLDPNVRSLYDDVRHRYLARVLQHYPALSQFELVVGTHPRDVDLLDFNLVYTLGIDEVAFQQCSTQVYGEPLMLPTEYACILSTIGDSVDEVLHASSWDGVSHTVVKHFPDVSLSKTVVDVSGIYRHLVHVMGEMHEPGSWLTLPMHVLAEVEALPDASGWAYLKTMRVEWRDAVAQLLGEAAAVESVFRLPWYVADPVRVDNLCCRTKADGTLALSMRGHNLVQFVRTRLTGYFNADEMVGTWIGAILSDATVVATLQQTVGTFALVGDESRARALTKYPADYDTVRYKVPTCVSWAYAACADVALVDCEDFESAVKFSKLSSSAGWAPSLRLVIRIAMQISSKRKRHEVVQFVWRIHRMGHLVYNILDDMVAVLERMYLPLEVTPSVRAYVASLMPGATHLRWIPQSMREKMLMSLGFYPSEHAIYDYLRMYCMDVANITCRIGKDRDRLSVMSGTSTMISRRLYGGRDEPHYDTGWCYLVLFQLRYQEAARDLLGPYPTFGEVMAVDEKWRIDDAMTTVMVTRTNLYVKEVPVLHMSLDGTESLFDFVQHVRKMQAGPGLFVCLEDVCVGAVVDTRRLVGRAACMEDCVDAGWKTGTIICATALVLLLLLYFCYLIAMRCGRGRAVGSGVRQWPGR